FQKDIFVRMNCKPCIWAACLHHPKARCPVMTVQSPIVHLSVRFHPISFAHTASFIQLSFGQHISIWEKRYIHSKILFHVGFKDTALPFSSVKKITSQRWNFLLLNIQQTLRSTPSLVLKKKVYLNAAFMFV